MKAINDIVAAALDALKIFRGDVGEKIVADSLVSALHQPITADDVETLFELILNRKTGNDKYRCQIESTGVTMGKFIQELRNCTELAHQFRAARPEVEPGVDLGVQPYRAPSALRRSQTDIRSILVVGSCEAYSWANAVKFAYPDLQADILLLGGHLAETPPKDVTAYDLQIVQLPGRSALPDMTFARLSQSDIAGHQALFDYALNVTRHMLQRAMRWNRCFGMLTFVFSYISPHQNLVGRTGPKYDLRNPKYFIDRLNEELYKIVTTEYTNAYFIDICEIADSIGRKYVSEDIIAIFNHGAFISDHDFGYDQVRLEPVRPASHTYASRVDAVRIAIWDEVIATYRSLRQTDSVKMVVVDLDDTLWRGVIADTDVDKMPSIEGWPIALWEALLFLKRRGILLAIITKNEQCRVEACWDGITLGRIQLNDFIAIKINWRQKSESMAEVLAETNLLPANVLFIDDNPVNRAEMQAVYPEMRILGGEPHLWRHILLLAPEMQPAAITAESEARTEMVQAQIRRETERKRMSSEEFLQTLDVRIQFSPIAGVDDPRFARVLELINKTNQFNTTGKRWTLEECVACFVSGVEFHAFEVTDRFTKYGLVGVLILTSGEIQQFVMSCRVMGLLAEAAAVAYAVNCLAERGDAEAFAQMIDSVRNLPCRGVYLQAGFEAAEGGWRRATTPRMNYPAHIAVALPRAM
jgi:FkbH-like protein